VAVTLIISLVSTPLQVTANSPTTPTLEINPHPTITATVSTQFTIQIWIRNIPEGYKLSSFDRISVYWDPTQMELIDHQEFTPSGKTWLFLGTIGPDQYGLKGEAKSTQDTTDLDMAWAYLTFHCLAEGTSTIDLISSVNGVYLSDGKTIYSTYPDSFAITCYQIQPAPVGGVLAQTNKLEILTPYFTLAGLIIAVSTVYVIKKRKD
jgi:hypothetical protein